MPQDPVQVLGLVMGALACSPTAPRHTWRCVGRRTQPVQVPGSTVAQYLLRFECPECSARGLVITMTPEHLWLLGVEIPGAGGAVS